MYRVVTKKRQMEGDECRAAIEPGPWQPHAEWAEHWAQFLRSTGLYYDVLVESSTENRSQQRFYS